MGQRLLYTMPSRIPSSPSHTRGRTGRETHGRLDAELLREIHRGGEAKEILLGLGRGHRSGGGAMLGGGEGCGGAGEGSEDGDLHHLE